MRRRGKAIAIATVTVGVVVLIAAGFAGKDWIREASYLHKLRNDDYETKQKIFRWLSQNEPHLGALKEMKSRLMWIGDWPGPVSEIRIDLTQQGGTYLLVEFPETKK